MKPLPARTSLGEGKSYERKKITPKTPEATLVRRHAVLPAWRKGIKKKKNLKFVRTRFAVPLSNSNVQKYPFIFFMERS